MKEGSVELQFLGFFSMHSNYEIDIFYSQRLKILYFLLVLVLHSTLKLQQVETLPIQTGKQCRNLSESDISFLFP